MMKSKSRGLKHFASLVVAVACLTALNTVAQGDEDSGGEGSEETYVPKTKRELSRILTPLQFDVTQNEATEPAFRNKYWNNKEEGVYKCIVCDRELFSSETKYKSGTGWPSFYAPISQKNVGERSDYRLFYRRIEIHCARCNAHLGHVFDDGPKPTGKRYCMNSASMKFVAKEDLAKESAESAAEEKEE